MQKLFPIFIVFLIAVSFSGCIEAPSIKFSDSKSLTITKSDSLIQDNISVSLEKNYNTIETYLPKSTVPNSIFIQPLSAELKSSSFFFLNSSTLLSSYLNKEIEIISGDKTYKGTLISVSPILLQSNSKIIELNSYDSISYTEEKYNSNPKLSIELFSKFPIKETINLSYLVQGITWKPSYSLFIDNQSSLFTSDFIITNNTQDTFSDFSISLSTTEKTPSYPLYYSAYDSKTSSIREEGQAYIQQSLSEHYLYEIKENQTILPNSQHSIPFFSSTPSFQKEYYFNTGYYTTEGKANLKYIIDNTESNSLGKPLPSGTVRIYEKKNSVFVPISETTIQNTQKNEKIELEAGSVFDIKVTSNLTQESYSPEGKENCTYRTISLSAISELSTQNNLNIYLSIPSDTTILSSPTYSMKDATTMKIPISLLPSVEKSFEVKIKSCYPIQVYKSYPESDYSEIPQ